MLPAEWAGCVAPAAAQQYEQENDKMSNGSIWAVSHERLVGWAHGEMRTHFLLVETAVIREVEGEGL